MPSRFAGVELAIIETPGKSGREAGINSARIVGTVTFASCFKYESVAQWRADFSRHRVSPEDPMFGFRLDKEKWGWIVSGVRRLPVAVPPPASRGLVYAKNCRVPDVAGEQ